MVLFVQLRQQALRAHQLEFGLQPLLGRVSEVVYHKVGDLVDLLQVVFFSHQGRIAIVQLFVSGVLVSPYDLWPYSAGVCILNNLGPIDLGGAQLILAALELHILVFLTT